MSVLAAEPVVEAALDSAPSPADCVFVLVVVGDKPWYTSFLWFISFIITLLLLLYNTKLCF